MNEFELNNLTMDDIDSMSTKQVQDALRDTRRVLVDRYKSQKADMGFTAPIYKSKKNNPYRMKIEGLTEKRAKNDLIHYLDLMGKQTTTPEGYREWYKKQNAIYNIGGMDKKKLDKIWELSDRIDQLHPALRSVVSYIKIMDTIIDMVENKNYVSITMVDKAMKNLAMNDSDASAYYAEQEWDDWE